MQEERGVPQNPLRTLLPVYLIVTALALAGIGYFTHGGLFGRFARLDSPTRKDKIVHPSAVTLDQRHLPLI